MSLVLRIRPCFLSSLSTDFYCVVVDIDFGHFLGNYKKFAGINRETAPFVFTPAYAYIMGGVNSKDFRQFEQLCCEAYNITRRNGDLLMNLFKLVRLLRILLMKRLNCSTGLERQFLHL